MDDVGEGVFEEPPRNALRDPVLPLLLPLAEEIVQREGPTSRGSLGEYSSKLAIIIGKNNR